MVWIGPRASTWVPRGAQRTGMDMGKGELPGGPQLASHSTAVPGHLRSPGRGGRSSSKPSQTGSSALPLGPKHPPAPTAPRNKPFTHQLHGTLKKKNPIKQHHRAGLSQALRAQGHAASACQGYMSPKQSRQPEGLTGCILPDTPSCPSP